MKRLVALVFVLALLTPSVAMARPRPIPRMSAYRMSRMHAHYPWLAHWWGR